MTRPEGDWRSGAYGANRTAHLFIYHIMETRKRAACGAVTTAKYRTASPTGREMVPCRECLNKVTGL